MVGVRIGEEAPGHGRDQRRLLHRPRQTDGDADVGVGQLLAQTMVVLDDRLDAPLLDLPQLDRLVVGRQQQVGIVGPAAPGYPVDALVDLQRLEVVELGLVRLELGVEAVLAGLLLPPGPAR